MELGPSIKPGDKVLRWESVKYDILVPATVLAVLETGSLRMAFFYLPAWTEAGRDQSPDAAYGVPALGRGWTGKAEEDAFWAPINAAVEEHRRRERAREAAAGEQLNLPTGVRIGLTRARIEEMSPEEQEALEEAAEAELQAERRVA